MPNFDQSTWLAYRVRTAQEMGPPKLPSHVALPGAKAAVPHDRLIAHQEAGHDQHEIVARANERWDRDNSGVIEQHQRWAAGPYQAAIEQMRIDAAEKAAEELRRRALFEQILAEREG
jgi:hypothetical protein